MMKLIVGMIVGLFVCAANLSAQTLSIKPNKNAYRISEKISFTIANPLTSSQGYYISAQAYVDGEWREVVYDFVRRVPYGHSVLIEPLGSGGTVVKTGKIQKSDIKYVVRKNQGVLCRLVVNYANPVGNIDHMAMSESFWVK